MRKNCLQTTLDEGLRHQRAGRLDQAAKSYQKILADDPRQPDALHLMGVIAHSVGHLEDAVELISESLRYNSENVSAINNLAGVLKDLGRYPEALEFYEAAIAAAPGESYLYSNLGNVLKEMERFDEAIASYRQSLKLDPASFAAHSNLGTVFKERGQLNEAAECYRQALKLNARSVEALSNLGVVLKEQGRFAESEQFLTEAFRLNPKSDAVCTNLGMAVKELGRSEEAIGWHLRALELNPDSPFALNNLGTLLKDQGRYAEAVVCFEKAIGVSPRFYLSYNNRGSALCELGRAREAVDCFRKSLELRPAYHHAFSNLLFALNYLPDTDRAELFAEHQRFDAQYCEPLHNLISMHLNTREPERRLRVGFVSGDLRDHPVVNFIEPVFAGHSAEQFELFCYSNTTKSDAVTARLHGQVEHWLDVAGLNDDELADAIRRDRIDILVDLSGHTAHNRLLVFARKPAPIQVSMIGYMQTTGLKAMDYRITDASLDPVGASEHLNVETLVRLEAGAAAFRPPAECPEVNESPFAKNGYITFGSFNNLAKVTPEALAAWAAILNEVPNSRLIIVGREGNPAHAALLGHGIAPERIEMIPRLPLAGYLQLHHRVDILLDTFPYNGGTTNLIALWMGVPFVTLEGGTTASRTGAGMLRGIQLDHFIASDVSEYVRKAVATAGDHSSLATLRGELREKLRVALDNGISFTGELEAAFRTMWRQWCAESGVSAENLPATAIA